MYSHIYTNISSINNSSSTSSINSINSISSFNPVSATISEEAPAAPQMKKHRQDNTQYGIYVYCTSNAVVKTALVWLNRAILCNNTFLLRNIARYYNLTEYCISHIKGKTNIGSSGNFSPCWDFLHECRHLGSHIVPVK